MEIKRNLDLDNKLVKEFSKRFPGLHIDSTDMTNILGADGASVAHAVPQVATFLIAASQGWGQAIRRAHEAETLLQQEHLIAAMKANQQAAK